MGILDIGYILLPPVMLWAVNLDLRCLSGTRSIVLAVFAAGWFLERKRSRLGNAPSAVQCSRLSGRRSDQGFGSQCDEREPYVTVKEIYSIRYTLQFNINQCL